MKVDLQHVMDTTQSLTKYFNLDNVGVVLTGPYTKKQKHILERKCNIRLDRILDALHWLMKNNRHYSHLTEKDLENLPQPKVQILLDENAEEESSGQDSIEEQVTYKVVFPDRMISQETGGHGSMEAFKSVIRRCKHLDGNTITILSESLDEVAPDNKDDNLVKAFQKIFLLV